MFDTDSGRATMKVKIVVLSRQATNYVSPNSYTDPSWYGGVVVNHR